MPEVCYADKAALCKIDFNGFFGVSLLLKSNSYIKLSKFKPSANPARLSQNVLTSSQRNLCRSLSPQSGA